MTHSIQSFLKIAEQFCEWVEAQPTNIEQEATKARSLLLSLYSAALLLPDPELLGDEPQDTLVPEVLRKQIAMRLSVLPFKYYSACINPLIIPAEAPGVADLADDISDVYWEIKRGLNLYSKGQVNQAVWEWQFGFNNHWGHHCISALYAIHCWFERK